MACSVAVAAWESRILALLIIVVSSALYVQSKIYDYVIDHAWESAYDDLLSEAPPVVSAESYIEQPLRIPLVARIWEPWLTQWRQLYRGIYHGRPPFYESLREAGYKRLPNQHRRSLPTISECPGDAE